MARGKHTCKILKEIRRQIAEANGIELVTSECQYKGDCLGTCPKCEAEVRYLEDQLRRRSLAGKTIALAGISASMILMAGCSHHVNNTGTTKFEPIALSGYTIIERVVDYNAPPFDPDKIYEVADEKPVFPGGPEALKKFISENIQLPDSLPASSKVGRVVVRLIIDKNGKAHSPQVMRSKNKELDDEALRIISILPNFEPAKLNGQNINYWYLLPFTFRYDNDRSR